MKQITKQVAPTPIRLPVAIKEWLKGEALRNKRSLNGEVLLRLEASREAQVPK